MLMTQDSSTDEGSLCPSSLQTASVPVDCSEHRRRGTSAGASPVSHPGCAGLPHPSPAVTHCPLEKIGHNIDGSMKATYLGV